MSAEENIQCAEDFIDKVIGNTIVWTGSLLTILHVEIFFGNHGHCDQTGEGPSSK